MATVKTKRRAKAVHRRAKIHGARMIVPAPKFVKDWQLYIKGNDFIIAQRGDKKYKTIPSIKVSDFKIAVPGKGYPVISSDEMNKLKTAASLLFNLPIIVPTDKPEDKPKDKPLIQAAVSIDTKPGNISNESVNIAIIALEGALAALRKLASK